MKRLLVTILTALVVIYSVAFFIASNLVFAAALAACFSGASAPIMQFWVSTALACLGGLVAILLTALITYVTTTKGDPK